MDTKLATYLFTLLIVIVVGFQLALAAGVPWGKVTMGGKFPGTLPRRMRVVSVVSAVLLVMFGLVVWARAGLAFSSWEQAARKGIWVAVSYCALGVVANAATPSKWERIIWLPVVLLMLACSALVAVS